MNAELIFSVTLSLHTFMGVVSYSIEFKVQFNHWFSSFFFKDFEIFLFIFCFVTKHSGGEIKLKKSKCVHEEN